MLFFFFFLDESFLRGLLRAGGWPKRHGKVCKTHCSMCLTKIFETFINKGMYL